MGIREAARIVVQGGWLAMYDIWFPAKMRDVAGFSDWLSGFLSGRYPFVEKFDHEAHTIVASGFQQIAQSDLEYWVPMDARVLCDYLMTHSERIAAIADGRETEDEQREYLSRGLAPFFHDAASREVGFGLAIELYRRVGA
jgi:hypothetical protein